MLGGSSGLNYMAYVRGHPADFDSWAEAGATGWSANATQLEGQAVVALALAPDDPKESDSPDAFKRLARLFGLHRDVQYIDDAKVPKLPADLSMEAKLFQEMVDLGLGSKACKAPQIMARVVSP